MRNFVNTQNKTLERDKDGHRTGFKIYIKVRKPMSKDGWDRWGIKQRIHIGKSKYVWKYYSSTRAMNMPNGVPIEFCKSEKSLAIWLITYMGLSEGETYAIHSWRGLSKKYPLPVLTKPLMIITILDVEKLAFKITKSGRYKRYWFTKTEDKTHMERIE